jgi:photosystem II stability/assembly factor-like uncharacterized protein
MADKHVPATADMSEGAAAALSRDWPGWLVALLVVVAAVYSFSPRPDHEFPPTGLKSDRVLLNDAVQNAARVLAVGEQGVILLADDPRGPWRQASVKTPRGSTLTRAMFLDGGVALAVGHDSLILRSTDQGSNWTEVNFDPERSEPLLGLAGPYDGRLYAFGAFGQFLVSQNNGLNWRRETLVEEGGAAPRPVVQSTDPADIFAGAADIGGGLAESHLNDMTRASDGSLVLVGERGLVARSTNGGASWRVVPEFYSGSFYGVMTLPSGRLLVHGMRGHVFYSDDHGRSWRPAKVPVANSLFAGTVLRNGDVLLAGASNTMLLSRDDGRNFVRVSRKGPHALASLLAFENGDLLKVGEGGLALVRLGQGQ